MLSWLNNKFTPTKLYYFTYRLGKFDGSMVLTHEGIL